MAVCHSRGILILLHAHDIQATASDRHRKYPQLARRLWLRSTTMVALTVVLLSPALADDNLGETPEYHVKAAFLYNFCKFIQWPDSAFQDDNSPIVLAVTDAAPFGDALKALDGRRVGQRTLEVREYRKPEEMNSCHILFIPKSDRARATAYLRQVSTAPVATVGETRSFMESGGMIRFVKRASNLRFQINPDSLREAALSVSSQLLKLAEQPNRNEREELQ